MSDFMDAPNSISAGARSDPDRPRWGSLQRSPDVRVPLDGFKELRGPTSKGKGGEGKEGRGEEGALDLSASSF